MANETNSTREVMNIPFGDIIREVAVGIAEAQFDLDKTSMLVAELMSGQQVLRDAATGEPILKDGEPQIIDSTVQFGHRFDEMGSGAAVQASIGNGSLKGIVIDRGGAKYTTAPTVTIAAPAGTSGTTATATAVIENGVVVAIEVDDAGSGYSTPPSVSITPPEETVGAQAAQAAAFAVLSAEVVGLEIVSAGEGYTEAPRIEISGAGGTGATATVAVDDQGQLAAINLGLGGSLYEEAPSVRIIPKVKPVAQQVSMMELGFVPNFYQFVDTVIDMRLALRVNKTEKGRYRLTASTVDANYASSYNYRLNMASRVKTKIVPIPPPTILEERLRQLLAQRNEIQEQDKLD